MNLRERRSGLLGGVDLRREEVRGTGRSGSQEKGGWRYWEEWREGELQLGYIVSEKNENQNQTLAATVRAATAGQSVCHNSV